MKLTLVLIVLAGIAYTQAPRKVSTMPRASLSDQRICADQAQKRFNEYVQSIPLKDRKDSIITTANHFDPKTTVCYVGLRNYFPDEGGVGEVMDVSDAFEQTLHASFVGGMNAKYENKVISCNVDEDDCHSAQEFRQLIRRKFGITL